MLPTVPEPALDKMFGPLPESSIASREEALTNLWCKIVDLRTSLHIRHPLEPPRRRVYGIKKRAGPIKDFGAKWHAWKAYCRLYDVMVNLTTEFFPFVRSPREAEYIRRHMNLYFVVGYPYTTYGGYLRQQKYKKALEELREKMIEMYKEREEEEKATWARINATLEKYEQRKK